MKEKLAEFCKQHFVNYKKLYIKQNEEIDKMISQHVKTVNSLNKKLLERKDQIELLNCEILDQKHHNLDLKDKMETLEKQFKDSNNQHVKDFINFNNKIAELKKAKRLLASSNGGLHTKILAQQKIINNYEKENQNIKNLLQNVVKESGRKLTPPTIQELNNYNLFGNKGGIKDAKNRNNISKSK